MNPQVASLLAAIDRGIITPANAENAIEQAGGDGGGMIGSGIPGMA